MKVTDILVAAVALAAGAEAQRPGAQRPNFASRVSSFFVGTTLTSRPTANPFAPSAASSSSGLRNPNIPSGQTQTASVTSLGQLPSIVPTIPSATSSVPLSTATVISGSNSTTGTNVTTSSNTTSCIQDAKSNPGLANSAQHRCSWGPGFDINTNYYTTWPNTGKTVKYTLTITNGTISPQGDRKLGFLVNGQSPGPTITADWGDMLEITVVNNLQHNGTSIHWHGLVQQNGNDQDGIGGVTQCPIAPGDSMTYKFQATQYGSSWYHSHFSSQYGEGVRGPIVINGPTSANYDVDLGTVMITDDYALTAFQETWLASRFGPPTAINYLLNGQNVKVDGSAGQRSKWTFTPGLKHKIRIINAAVDHQYKVQIDQHDLLVVAMDFIPLNPYSTKELSLSTGQRYDIIVEAKQPVGNYWFRALKAGDCSFGANDGTGNANGIISYTGASGALPTSRLTTTHSNACVDEPISVLKPVFALNVDSAPFTSAVSSLGVGVGTVRTTNDTVFQWNIGGISQVIDWSAPVLQSSVASVNQFDTARHIVSLPTANVWTYWVLQNQFFAPHPMHLHGHDFFILGTGTGTFSASANLGQLNFTNPPRRDTVQLTSQGWAVVAFKTDNPGAWLLHCHISWHAAGGLSLGFLERPSEIPSMYGNKVNSQAYKNTCSNWKTYAATMVYHQDDSGLKKRETIGGNVELEMEVMDEMPERRALEKTVVRREVSHWGNQAY
ncbi:hypothetical protein LTR05_002894 [Lithohypha guttulata]|uniref:laccase n=1 Tax=Lithohypha guttulata TaxID=1690604 RepID=A0AAN7T3Z7_9EURO|nr:hypothetical protein LTR05_002894 [Lithohypha guttulata]